MQPEHATDRSPPSSAVVMEEYSYTFTHPLGHTGPVTGTLYLFLHLCTVYVHLHIVYLFISNPITM